MNAAAGLGTVVCVLGPSRSGTSLTARLLNLAGVYLGREEELLQKELRQLAGDGEAVLARAAAANPDGFWEHYRIMRLNERVLCALGGSWRDPPSPSPGWEASSELSAEREEAGALLRESFGSHPLWGWKDPRNALTLPFWQQLLPEMLYVICVRNPLDAAASLQRRDEMPLEQGVDLWQTYLARALLHTAGRPRLLVGYESYFDDSHAAAERLARFVGRGGAFEGDDASRQLDQAVNERLWRHRTPVEDAAADPRIPDTAVALHLLTQSLAVAADGV